MIARKNVDTSEKSEEIERVVQSLVDQSPALGAAFDRVNSFNSTMSELNLNTTGQDPENISCKSKRPPPLFRRSSPLGSDRKSSISNISTVSSSSRPEARSDSETIFSEPWTTSSCSSVEPSPVFCKPPLLSSKSAKSRRWNSTRSSPPLPPLSPPAISGSFPPGPPLSFRRPALDDQSIRLPPAMWEDDVTIREPKIDSPIPSIRSTKSVKHKTSTASQHASFEKELFKNSAIYCDL